MDLDFTFRERLGVFLIIEASCLSVASVSFILGFAVYKWLRRAVSSWGRGVMRSPDASDSSLFLNLMLADLIQAIGNLPSIRWMMQAHITEGHLCTAQAAVKQVGIVGVSMTSLAIAIHTFSVLVLRWKAPRYITRAMVVGVWAFVAIDIGVANAVHRDKRYYGDTGYWCWIVKNFKVEQIVTEYLWVWIAGFLMAILYTIMFVVIRGWFIIDNGVHWHKNYVPSHPNMILEVENDEEKRAKAIANLMLFYPAVYIFCVFPNSLARWLSFSGYHTPYEFTLFANTVFALSGTLNVTLFFLTRPELVVGSKSDHIDDENVPLHRRNESIGKNSSKLGHLPERAYVNPPANATELLADQQEFDPRILSNNIYTVSQSLTVPLPARGNPSSIYRSGGRNGHKQSNESTSLIEDEEDYGRLPG